MKFRHYSVALFLIVSALFALTGSTAFASSTWINETTGTSLSGLYWYTLTSSADGTKLAAGLEAPPGDIYTSTDSGATWTDETTGTSASNQTWTDLTSSSDGTKLAAVNGNGLTGDIYTSTDSGATWTNRTTGTALSDLYWYRITSSSDGTRLVAVVYGGDIWTSANSGVTWTDASTTASATNQNWNTITSSADGTKLVAVVNGGDIWTSADSGVTWTDASTTAGTVGQGWNTITSSSDGTKLAATVFLGDIWTSTDSGVTWVNRTTGTPAGGLKWRGITSSADGTKLAAMETNLTDIGDIWTSTDSGQHWTNETTGTSASGLGWRRITSSADGTKLAAIESIFHSAGDIWTATYYPTLTTSAASAVYDTSVTLNGSITDVGINGSSTIRGFVYGTNTSYGATTTESGSFSTGAFSAPLSALTCNMTYHFAAYATNGYLGYGNDQTLTTSACPSSGGGGMIVGSGPTAPSAAGLSGYTPPRPQIDYPNGTVAYLDATSSASTTPPSPTTPSAPATATAGSLAASPTVSFPHNLQFWDQGADILMLQQFLNTHGFIIATNGPGSEGSETNFFGPHTYRALIKFQSANNLPATGYFGPLTRALINSQIQ